MVKGCWVLMAGNETIFETLESLAFIRSSGINFALKRVSNGRQRSDSFLPLYVASSLINLFLI